MRRESTPSNHESRNKRNGRLASAMAALVLIPGALSGCGDIELKPRTHMADSSRQFLSADQKNDLKQQAMGRVMELLAGYSGEDIKNGLGTLHALRDIQTGSGKDDASGHDVEFRSKDELSVRVIAIPNGTEVLFTHTNLDYGLDTFRHDVVAMSNPDAESEDRDDTFVFVSNKTEALATDEVLHMKDLMDFLNAPSTKLESVGDRHNRSLYPLTMDAGSGITADDYFDTVSTKIQG